LFEGAGNVLQEDADLTFDGTTLVSKRIEATLASVIPVWQATTAYLTDDVVSEDNTFYKRTSDGTSGATFDTTELQSWEILSGENFAPLSLGDFPTGGSIGTAANTVDVYQAINIAQGTSTQTLTIPTPTDTSNIRNLLITNNGSESFLIGTDTILNNTTVLYVWNGSVWKPIFAKALGGGWNLLFAPQTLDANKNYVAIASGTYSLPSGATQGDVIEFIASASSVVLSNPFGAIFSAPGVMSSSITLPLYAKFTIFSVGGDNWSIIKQFPARVAFTDQATGTLGDNDSLLSDVWLVNQTTAGQVMTLPTGLQPDATFLIQIQNTGTASFTVEGAPVEPGSFVPFLFNGTDWQTTASGDIEAIDPWAAATFYYQDQKVTQNGRILQRIAAGTSGATFDATEAADWTLLQTAPVTDWVANTYYYANEITWQDPYFLRRLFNGTSGASFDNTEKTNWAKISAETPQVWAPSTRYYGGDLVTYNETLLQRITAGVSQATFNVAEAITWEYVAFQEILGWQSNINYPLNSIVGSSGDRVIQNVGIHVGGATFDAAEAANWRLITPMVTQSWQANFYYYAGEQAFNNGVLLRRSIGGMSGATFDSTEALDWAVVAFPNPDSSFVGSAFYFAGQGIVVNGVGYHRLNDGVSGATFDTTEAAFWRVSGTYSTPFVKTVTDADSPYTVASTDGPIFVDSSGGVVTINFDVALPEGKQFPFYYIQTANAITVAGTGGTTVTSPITYTQTASFTAPGSVGQYGSTIWMRNGNEFVFFG